VNSRCERSSDQVDILTDVEHHDGDTAVLTDGHAFSRSDLVIPNELLQRLSPKE
jgi:hypothetical protein